LTQTGAVVGTPLYMAREQFLGEPADPRTDQFSFCVALYEALYKERPYGGTTYMEIAEEVIENRLRPRPKANGVPEALYPVLRRGLESMREQRYPSLDALLADLQLAVAPRRKGGARIVLAMVGVAAIAASLFAVARWKDSEGPPAPPTAANATEPPRAAPTAMPAAAPDVTVSPSPSASAPDAMSAPAPDDTAASAPDTSLPSGAVPDAISSADRGASAVEHAKTPVKRPAGGAKKPRTAAPVSSADTSSNHSSTNEGSGSPSTSSSTDEVESDPNTSTINPFEKKNKP
jgi:serine/threonine protein kinase